MRHITQLDLFSGIGGFHLGFERAGYKVTSFFSEVDKHAIAVYKHQFKDSTYVGSVTDVRGADLPSIDLITFGSPCQDFSLAGKRAGMEGQRSSLILEAIRLIHECRPRVFVWENVKGTFSSNNGADFWAIIQAFANIGGYRLEWQLLNTSWVLPQNRERIYLVGYSTAPERDWRGVFPVAASGGATDELPRHNPRANTITTRYTADSNGSFIGEHQQPAQEVKQVGNKLDSNGGTQPYQQDRVYDADGIVPALNQGKSDLILRIKTANQKGYQEAEAGDAVRLYQPESNTQRGRVGKGIAHTLETTGQQGVVDSYRIRRLTPIECERLQGFPDDHTAFGNYDGEVKPMSNTQRYKQCGNAVTVDIVSLVAEQLKPIFDA
jgi:DNA (cytosine-5)-methyltransferase 1